MSLDRLFYAFHLFGVIMWVSGLFALTYFLDAAKAETDAGAKKRLTAYTRKMARIPDIGATLALVFGAHLLFRFKFYTVPYMHAKLLLVVFLIGMHGFLRVKTKRAAEGQDTGAPAWARPLMSAIVLGILVFVMTKVPT